MNFIIDKYEDEQFYLIEAYDDLYLGWLKTPTDKYTIEEYKKWRYEYTNGFISINDKRLPQCIQHSAIKEFVCIDDIVNHIAETHSMTKEEFCIPIIGGIIGFDFRELLSKLFDAGKENSLSFYRAKEIIHTYYEDVITKRKNISV